VGLKRQVVRSLVAALERALRDRVASMRPLGGGDFAEAFQVETTGGPTVFAKTHRNPPPGFFSTEATGLRWLRAPYHVAVPRVLAVSDGDGDIPAFLVLEWIDERHGVGKPDEADFGRSLARLHRTGLPSFGREDGRSTGSRGLPNAPCDSWVEFYAERRLRPLTHLALSTAAISDRAIALLDEVIERLPALGGPPEPPARLHGDLWAGNRIVDASGRSWLVDPAAHGGHREFDLAMMRLFGGFGDAAFDAYDDEFPLADGWQRRVPLHQLGPLIVHAIKFGGGYPSAVERALAECLT